MKAEDKLKRIKSDKLIDDAYNLKLEKRYDESFNLLVEAKEIDPNNPSVYSQLAWLFYDLDDHVKAESTLNEGIKLGLVSVDLYIPKGHYYFNIKEYKKALSIYKKAEKIEPKDYLVLSSIGGTYYKIGDLKKATKYLDECLKIKRDYKWALGYKGLIAKDIGDINSAKKYFKLADWVENLSELEKDVSKVWTKLPMINEMVSYLDKYVIGQDQAKIDLSSAIYQHYISLAWRADNIVNDSLGRFNSIFVGPSGSGKNYMIELLAKKLDVPFAVINTTSLTRSGYVGKDVDSILVELINNSNLNIKRAEKGIIFLDEIDKIAGSKSTELDVNGTSVQNSLLAYLEGINCSVEINKVNYTIDTSKILFIGAGAFVGIDEIVKKRLNKSKNSIGFGSSKIELNDIVNNITIEDFESYGLISQFMGRFPIVSFLNQLSKADLKSILLNLENTILSKQKKLFELHGIKLTITEDAIDYIIEKIDSNKTGARALRTAIINTLKKYFHKIDLLVENKTTELIIDINAIKSDKAILNSSQSDSDLSVLERLRINSFV